MNGKQFAITTSFAVILLVLVFIPLAHQQGGGTYDPWLDSNGDGKINVSDLQPLGQAYGNSGDPTRNVNVTNFPLDRQGNIMVSVQNGTPTVKTAVQSIVILDSMGLQNGQYTYGAYIVSSTSSSSSFYFNFDPKPTFARVTDIYASGVWSFTSGGNYSVDYLIDGSTVLSGTVSIVSSLPSGHTHSAALSSLTPGVHRLTIRTGSTYTLYLCRLEIFIAYQYQA
jgi:hypothetical protein